MAGGRRCPKCGSRDFYVVEVWRGMTIEFYRGEEEGYLSLDGDPYKVEGNCEECGHCWTFRGLIQADEASLEQIWGTKVSRGLPPLTNET